MSTTQADTAEATEAPKETAEVPQQAAISEEQRARLLKACEKDLAVAQESAVAAISFLDHLSMRDFPEVGKAFLKPPTTVTPVMGCIIHLWAGVDGQEEVACSDRGRRGLPKDVSFQQFERLVRNPAEFMSRLREIPFAHVPQANIAEVRRIVEAAGDDFSGDVIRKSKDRWAALAGALAEWVRLVLAYFDAGAAVEETKKRVLAEKPDA